MKKLIILLLLLGVATISYAQDEQPEQSGKATVYFIRQTGYAGAATAYSVLMDGKVMCRLNNRRYSIHEVDPGEHSVVAQFAGKQQKAKAEVITMNLEAGKTYYVQLVQQERALVGNVYCQEVTESSAKVILPKCKLDADCGVENQ